MNGDARLGTFLGVSILPTGLRVFIEHATPYLNFVLILVQLIAGIAAVVHLVKRYRKNNNK